jgi:hypothetical protein
MAPPSIAQLGRRSFISSSSGRRREGTLSALRRAVAERRARFAIPPRDGSTPLPPFIQWKGGAGPFDHGLSCALHVSRALPTLAPSGGPLGKRRAPGRRVDCSGAAADPVQDPARAGGARGTAPAHHAGRPRPRRGCPRFRLRGDRTRGEAVAYVLRARGERYVVVNPLATFRVREARQLSREKTDLTDAEQIAELCRTGLSLRPNWRPAPTWRCGAPATSMPSSGRSGRASRS